MLQGNPQALSKGAHAQRSSPRSIFTPRGKTKLFSIQWDMLVVQISFFFFSQTGCSSVKWNRTWSATCLGWDLTVNGLPPPDSTFKVATCCWHFLSSCEERNSVAQSIGYELLWLIGNSRTEVHNDIRFGRLRAKCLCLSQYAGTQWIAKLPLSVSWLASVMHVFWEMCYFSLSSQLPLDSHFLLIV